MPVNDPFQLTADQLQHLLATDVPHLPEVEAARGDLAALHSAPQTQVVLARTERCMEAIEQIPQTVYTQYRRFVRDGDREGYQMPYFEKRTNLAAAVLRMFLGQSELKDTAQDYLWNICEESNWVVPAHERGIIDLFAAETGFMLAETLALLGDQLDAEVRHRVRTEIEQRIFDPYLRFHLGHWWYMGHNNWNGVCNSSVAATFLLLDPEPGRVARALEIALAGLRVFLDTAFEEDGSSTEGVGYWHYGLINFVSLSEMLRARSGGQIDLLASDHVRHIAVYPAKMQLSGPHFASFSDCDETLRFNPGIISRLAERTGERSLLNLLAHPAEPTGDWRLTMMLRNMLWWDGRQPDAPRIDDAVLPVGGVARLVAQTPAGRSVALAIKAGHNAENHNQNDVGSFVLHVDSENLLTDPGRGLYNRAYFSERRYENIFANSYGHSVPRIGGALQSAGREFSGELLEVETSGPVKHALVDFTRAYPVEGLTSARRKVSLTAEGGGSGTVGLQDDFSFSGRPAEVEEALITWLDVEVNGSTAAIRGERHTLRLTIEEPQGTTFHLERLEEESRANAKPGVLKRLTFVLPAMAEVQARVRMDFIS